MCLKSFKFYLQKGLMLLQVYFSFLNSSSDPNKSVSIFLSTSVWQICFEMTNIYRFVMWQQLSNTEPP